MSLLNRSFKNASADKGHNNILVIIAHIVYIDVDCVYRLCMEI